MLLFTMKNTTLQTGYSCDESGPEGHYISAKTEKKQLTFLQNAFYLSSSHRI